MLNIISLGAGVQSSTMALMAAQGEITPMPDAAIFADTQAEPQAVYEWLDWLCGKLPFPVYRVTKGNLRNDSLILRRSKKSGKLYQRSIIPFYVSHGDGRKEILQRRCTGDYKIRLIEREARRLCGPAAIRAWRKEGSTIPLVEQWIGISSDEAHRMKPSSVSWISHCWPLVDRRMSRSDCLAWMSKRGYPKPPRSACVFCPYHSDAEWIRLRKESPEEFALAIQFEKEAQAGYAKDEVTNGVPYLHNSRIPLDLVKLDPKDQLSMFGNECEGMCGV